jgi:ABC-2 type transport system permease protein
MAVLTIPDAPPVAPAAQAWLFQRLRWRVVRNAGSLLFSNSRVRLVTIVLCSLLIAGTVFAGSLEGFRLLERQNIPFSGRLVGTLFDFLFLALAVLLIFSGGLILYSSLFASPETDFLLSTPARADQVFAYKFQTAITFSSWGFLLLGLPILVAYGLVFAVPWFYYALLPVYFVGFLLVPGSVGAVACFLIVNVTPQRRKQVLAAVVAIVIVGGIQWTYRTLQEVRHPPSSRDALQWLDARFAFSRAPLMPSHWMTRGIQAAARGDVIGAAYPLALLWSNGLMAYVAAAYAASRLYRRGYNRLATGGAIRKRFGRAAWLDRAADRALGFLDPQTRLLIIKDFRTFRRDPAQWAQILIFAGLMLLYFLNSPQFYQNDRGRSFQHVISFTNRSATAMLMCAYMSRFVYPMLSLEGRKFWILGLLPLERERLLWGKFAFAATGGVLVGCALVTASDVLLGLPAALALHLPAVVLLAVGLSGLSVGLGACVPNFRETDPSKIAVGFGGTLNLIAGLLYLLLVIALTAGPYHLAAGFHPDEGPPPQAWGWVAAGVAAGIALGVAAAVLPLRAGARVLKRMEF